MNRTSEGIGGGRVGDATAGPVGLEAISTQLLTSIQEGIAVFDRDLRCQLWNPFLEGLTGLPAARVLGRHPWEALTGFDPEQLRAWLEQALGGQAVVTPDLACEHPDLGRRAWLAARFTPLRDTVGRTVGVIGFMADISARREAEQALHREREFLRKIIDSVPAFICVKDAHGRMELANASMAAAFQIPVAAFVGRTDTDLKLDAGQVAKYRHDDHEVLRTGQTRMVAEERVRYADGKERFHSTVKVPLVGPDGGWQHVLVISHDITGRREAEETLRLRSAALEFAANGIVIIDPAGTVVWCNPAFSELTGYSFEEIVGRDISLLRSGKHPPEFYHRMWETVLAGRVWRGELINRRKDGSLYHEEQTITPVPDAAGNITHFVAVKQDTTQRQLMQRELQLSRERFQHLFHATPVPIFISTLEEGRLVEVNESFLRFAGCARGEIAGRTSQELGFWSDPAEQAGLIELLRRSEGCVRNREMHFRDRRGQVHRVLVSGDRLQVGLDACLFGCLLDVTEVKLMEEQLRQAAKLEAIGQLAGGVAHDFNNILTIIQGHANLVLVDPALPAEAQESVFEIARAAERAANLTRQLLAFGRRQPLQLRCLNLNEVIEDLGRMLRRLIGENIALEITCGPQLPRIRADGGMMEQILMNLAINARDAMRGGGTLCIETSRRRVERPRVPPPPEALRNEYVCIAVRDTGAGIPADVLPRIFEPFFTTKEVGKGSGLGLATVHGIAQQHHGWVEVESRVGQGTTFSVFLPASAEPAAPPVVEAAAGGVRGGSETILLVEDEGPVRELARQVLLRHGYRVLEAADGAAALRLWEEHAGGVDLLFSDVVMPGECNGKELALRLTRSKPGLPVLLTSGYSADLLGEDAAPSWRETLLHKPYHPRQLLEAIRACLDRA